MSRDNDESLFLQVARELSANKKDEGLWLKAYALENGDEAKAKAHYARLRVEKLRELRDSKVQNIQEIKVNISPPIVLESAERAPPPVEESPAEASLWARLWARNIDFLICMTVYLALTATATANVENLFIAFLIAFTVPGAVLVLYDAVLISNFGQTIGKSFFGIRVLDNNGDKLAFQSSLKRAVKVWAYGNGGYFFFPAATLFAWWYARRGITLNGTSTWDSSTGSFVTQSVIGSLREVLATLAGISCLLIAVLVSYGLKQHNKNIFREAFTPSINGALQERSPSTEKRASKASNPFDQFDAPPAPPAPPPQTTSGDIFSQLGLPRPEAKKTGNEQKKGLYDDILYPGRISVEEQQRTMRDGGVGGTQNESDVRAWGAGRLLTLLHDRDAYQLAMNGVEQWKSLIVTKAGWPDGYAIYMAFNIQLDSISKNMVCFPDFSRGGGLTVIDNGNKFEYFPTCHKLAP